MGLYSRVSHKMPISKVTVQAAWCLVLSGMPQGIRDICMGKAGDLCLSAAAAGGWMGSSDGTGVWIIKLHLFTREWAWMTLGHLG